MTTAIIETNYQKKVRERNENIIRRYKELMSVEGQLKTPVVHQLMDEFDISSNSTIYSILKNS